MEIAHLVGVPGTKHLQFAAANHVTHPMALCAVVLSHSDPFHEEVKVDTDGVTVITCYPFRDVTSAKTRVNMRATKTDEGIHKMLQQLSHAEDLQKQRRSLTTRLLIRKEHHLCGRDI